MSKLIEVIKSFKYSVNVKDDYRNMQKLNGFFTTKNNADFLLKTCEAILSSNNKSLMLSGAYGTGKSFLTAIIAAIVSGKFNFDTDFKELKNKLDALDKDYAKSLSKFASKKYIIVFPDDSFSDFSQAICLGITSAIEEYKLDIVLNSTYHDIIQRIERWEKTHPAFYDNLEKSLAKKRWSIKKLLKSLNEFSYDAFLLFQEIYPQIMAGEKFIPLGSSHNITSILRDFESEVRNIGFDGVLYVFDEFGRFLENNISSIDVKEVQDAAEYCNSGRNSSLLLVSHKDIFQYSQRLHNDALRDEWEKVSGRFSKTHLLYEESNILSIIEAILKKRHSVFKKFITSYKDICSYYTEQLESISVQSPEHTFNIFYPLNYVTALMLPKLSQRLAQNERTLFSFLCGNEVFALNNIFKNDSSCFQLITPDYLYDYFEDNFIFLGTTSREYKIYLNARMIIKALATDTNSSRLIKTLALFYLLNEYNELPPNRQFLLFASGLTIDEFNKSISLLQEKGYIAYRKHLDRFILSQDIDFNIDASLAKIVPELNNMDYIGTLTNCTNLPIEFPVKYNFTYKITRFFTRKFIDISKLAQLEGAFLDAVEDGVIFYITNFENAIDVKDKLLKASSIYHNAIFACADLKHFDVKDALMRLEALSRLEGLDDTFKLSSVAKEELEHYRNELTEYLELRVEKTWNIHNKLLLIFHGQLWESHNVEEYQNYLHTFLENRYPYFKKEFIINYELVNKSKLTIPIKAARKEILKKIITQDWNDEYFESTGAANSIARILIKNTNIWNGISFDCMKSRFSELFYDLKKLLSEQSISYNDIMLYFASNNSKYGFRNGVFSFIFGFFLLQNKGNILISYDNAEVPLSEDILDVLENAPAKYNISLLQIPDDARKYLQQVANNPIFSFFIEDTKNDKDITVLLYEGFKKLIFSLPKIIFTERNPETHVPLTKLVNGLDSNNSKTFFFQRLPRLYKSNDWSVIALTWFDDIQIILQARDMFIEQIRNITKNALNKHDTQLGVCIAKWKTTLDKTQLDRITTSVLPWQKDGILDEQELLRQTTSAIRGGIDYIQWRSNEDIYDYNNSLRAELDSITEGNPTLNIDTQVILTDLGEILKKKLLADIEAFKGISQQEVQNVIVRLLQDLNKGGK